MAIFCVRTDSEEFKNKAESFNISNGQLENILHEYGNSEELQGLYPNEDDFINARLNGESLVGASDSQMKAWNELYSMPRTFTNANDFNQAVINAEEIFGRNSVGRIERPDGTYELIVAQPVNSAYIKELNSIKEKAITDGTFMKAPNGNQSNLNEQQWLQVRTKAFKDWFGDWENDPENASKVVDKNGEPLVVYHGGARGISVFKTGSKDLSNTGYGYYTDEKTGEKIPVDSARTMFFSSNKFVGKSYAQLYALQHFKDLYNKTQNMIGNFYNGKASFSSEDFKSIDEFYEFLTVISEFNPRFAKLRDYIKELQSRGERLKPNQVEAARQLFIDLRSTLEEYTQSWNLASSEWDNQLTIGKSIIQEYLGGHYFGDNIYRLKEGEIPEYLKKEWDIFTKIQEHRKKYGLPEIENYKYVHVWLSSGQSYTDSDFMLKYDGKELIFDETRGRRDVPVSQMSIQEITEFFTMASQANTYSFWERDNDRVKAKYDDISGQYPVFLNVRNPLIHDYEGTHMSRGYKQNPKVSFGYVAARQVNKAIKGGNDGVVYQNIYDPYLADNYGVFDPNQIKSATENIGTFSRENDNIYNNQNIVEKSILDNLASNPNGFNYFERVGNKVKLKGDRIEAIKALQLYVKSRELPSDYIGVTKEGYLYEKTKKYPLQDQIEAYKESEDLFESAEQQEQAMQVLEFLKEKTGLNYEFISEDRAKELLNGKSIDGVNAFVRGNTAYFIKGNNRRFNTDIASEEMLHPFVSSIRANNSRAFESLRRDASKAFPILAKQIESTYTSDVQEELVTQALSRAFRKDYEKNPNHNAIKDLITKFWNYVKGWFRNSGDIPIFSNTDKLYAQDLSETITLENLAKIINSELLLGNADRINRVALSQQESSSFEIEEVSDYFTENSPEAKAIRPENQGFFRRQLALSKGADILYNNEIGLTTSEITDEAVKLSNWVSDKITDTQLNPEQAFDVFGLPKTNDWTNETDRENDIDSIRKMSRRKLVSKIGLPKFMNAYNQEVFIENDALDDLVGRNLKKVNLLSNNISTLFELGMSTLSQNEGYGIVHNDTLGTYETVDSTGESILEEDNVADIAALAEEGVSLEDWMVDKTTVEVLGNATAQVRSALSQGYQYDENGNIKRDYLGRPERLSQNDAVKSIVRWTQGSNDINQMIQKLDDKAANNPWLNQILGRLKDTSGNEADFISQFYTTFQKHFTLFDIVKKNKNKHYFFMDVNNRPALSNALDEVIVNFNINQSPLFTTYGFNTNNLKRFNTIVSDLNKNAKMSEEQFNQYKNALVDRIADASSLLGYKISSDDVAKSLTYNNLNNAIKALSNIADVLNNVGNNGINYNPFEFSRDKKSASIYSYTKNFLSVVTDSLEDTAESSYYENGKMMQSYQIPSYATKLFSKLISDNESFSNTLTTEYGNYQWFFDNGRWRTSWLRDLTGMDEKTRKEVLVYKRNLNFLGDQYMRGMTPEKYALSVLTEFGASRSTGNGNLVSFYRFPIQSNKASSDFVSFYRYTGDFYKSTIIGNLMLTFGQELSRIQTSLMRSKSKEDSNYIANFDGERGKQFCFLDFLNTPENLIDENFTAENAREFKSLVDAKVHGEEVDIVKLEYLAQKAIESGLNQKTTEAMQRFAALGIMDAIRNIEGVINQKSPFSADQQVNDFIENFVWNDTLAAINITELLVTDLAFYEGSDDFQKRFAQVHSPGVRGNKFATDYDGKPVSDGYIRTVFLNDFDTYKENIIDNLKIVLDRNIAQASEDSKAAYIALEDDILKRMSKINVTDGQALSSPTSVRKKGFMFGQWSREAEEAYEKITTGNYKIRDLEVAFNVKKPFVYTQLPQRVTTEGTPISNLKVGTQIKDSEYMLVMAGALLSNQDTGIPNLLKVLYDVMEESAFDTMQVSGKEMKVPNKKGIDTFAFSSTVKTGLTGSSDVSTMWANKDYSDNVEEAETELKNHLLSQIYNLDENGNIDRNSYNEFTVKAIPVEDYALQTEVPLHMIDQKAIWGSQMRAILQSNLNYIDYNGNPVTFSWTDNNGEHTVGRDEFRRLYEENVEKLVNLYVDRLKNEFGLGEYYKSSADTRISIAKALQDEIRSNIERYGVDMLLACSITEDGNFRLPLGDPTQSKRIEQLINSIIKNRLNKPKVSGGMGVQVSSFGTTRELNFRFYDKSTGNLLPTREEWLKDNPNGDYLAYCKENQGGFAYEENYAPAHMRDFFNYFTDENGEVDIEAIEMLDENLLYSIDQRTPTEFYYSISVAKIVGFLSEKSGDGFMRPYGITEKDDSDFDVDKETKWKLQAKIIKNNNRIDIDKFIESVPALSSMKKGDARKVAKNFLYDTNKFQNSKDVKDNPELFREMKRAWIKQSFSVEYPTEGEGALMNNAWQMSKTVLQHESNAAKILSPGGNADLAREGYLVRAMETTGSTYDDLNSLSFEELKNIVKNTDQNIMFFTNQLEYYQRNNDASSNLGIFAVAATSHNLVEGNGYGVANEEAFTIAGKEYGNVVEFDPMYDDEGMLVSKSLGSNVSGAADAAKVPSHGYLNVNSGTINEYLVLLRTGMPAKIAQDFIAARPLKNIISEFNSKNVERFTTRLSDLIDSRISDIRREYSIDLDSPIYKEELTYDEIKQALTDKVSPELEFKVLIMFKRLSNLTEGMREITFATRFNSVASAVGPQIIDNLTFENQMNNYMNNTDTSPIVKTVYTFYDAKNNNAVKHFGDTVVDNSGNTIVLTKDTYSILEEQGIITVDTYNENIGINEILQEHPMLKAFSSGYDVANDIFTSLRMPLALRSFSNLLNYRSNYSSFFFKNRYALNKLSDFYLSYLLIASDVIYTGNDRKYDGPAYFIRKFPSDFLSRRSKYAGNALIDAIHPKVDDSGVISLELSTTGMKIDDKTKLQSAWIELYNTSPDLAMMLFKYNFWKGGIGFSPKTFMNLLPMQVKERIDGYADTFNDSPSVSSGLILNQFFRNNAYDNKIVRFISDFSNLPQSQEKVRGQVTFVGSAYDKMKDTPFFKFKKDDVLHVLGLISSDSEKKTLTYVEYTPLGNNGEFVEISTNNIASSIVESRLVDSDGFGETEDTNNGENLDEFVQSIPTSRTDEQIEQEVQEYIAYFKDANGNYIANPEGLINFARKVKTGKIAVDVDFVKSQRDRTKAFFERNGINYDENTINDIVKKLC